MTSTATESTTIYVDNIPPGGIIMWNNQKIPTGWALCDGNNGRPDLTDKFVRGASIETLGHHGGQNQIQLGLEHLPKHSHEVSDPGHHHTSTEI